MLQSARASVDTQDAKRHSGPAPGPVREADRMHTNSERTAWSGNQSHLRLLPLQRKLAIGSVNDPLEAEADRVAEHVTRTATPPPLEPRPSPLHLSRKCASCKEEEQKLQTKSADPGSPATGEAPGIVQEVLRSSGKPLDRTTRSFFEPRFGHDFSGVRIHTDAHAAESARQVNALAYTVGSDVVFSSQQFAPNTAYGQRLLAHELTHVVQQSGSGRSAASTLRRSPVPSTPAPAAKNVVPAPKPDFSNGCYGPNGNGRGKVKAVGANQWVLSNFDIDQHYVKKDHFDFLKNTVVPKINATPAGKFSVMIIGEASTTADFAYNLDLSKWRANCVAEELVAAGLDDQHRTSIVTQTGELRGDLEQILHGIDPRIGIEDSTKRMVTILLVPAECTPEIRSRASQKFFAKVACSSESSIRINIGVADPSQPIYREFAWLHNPWPQGCTFIPGLAPNFAAHGDFVQAALDLRLATGDPDQIYGPSDFTGPLTFFAYGANEYLARDGLFKLFKIGLGGVWKPESCGAKSQIVEGELIPLGPVQCGWAPDPPGHCDFAEKKEECSDDHKMAASKRFNGYMVGGSVSGEEVLELIERELPSWARQLHRVIDLVPSWIRKHLDPGGVALRVQFGTRDSTVDPSLTRSFTFLGLGNQGGGESFTEHFQGAVAPDQDATEPSQLATENPNKILASSDLSKLNAKLVIQGASNKIELTTGAGTFKFFNGLCNHGGTRNYYGPLFPLGTVNCPDHIDLPKLSERECKEEEVCPESTRTAGHKQFTVKVGRATLASLPLAGRKLANEFGCTFGAAFLNIQSEDGPKEKQIHREFLVVFRQNDCRFTVGNAHSPISSWFNHQLAISDPDSILASSDFTPFARLNQDGELRLISDSKVNTPLLFKLPGAFDPACKLSSGRWGTAIPLSAVACGPASEPKNDSTPEVNHTDDCNQFRKQHAYFVDPYIHLIGSSDYQDLYSRLPPGRAIIPPKEFGYYKEDFVDINLKTVSPAVFVALAQNPQGGQPIQVVAFADLRIIRLTLDGGMVIQFLTDVCAFDEFGNVVLIRPDNCVEGFYHIGDEEIVHPIPVPRPRLNLPRLPKLPLLTKPAFGSVNDPLEIEADRIADRVTPMPAPSIATSQVVPDSMPGVIHRCSCGGTCDACKHETELRRKQEGASSTETPSEYPAQIS
jgi:outer membrane protein OmpA-like peptidoglycan-associated protein